MENPSIHNQRGRNEYTISMNIPKVKTHQNRVDICLDNRGTFR